VTLARSAAHDDLVAVGVLADDLDADLRLVSEGAACG